MSSAPGGGTASVLSRFPVAQAASLEQLRGNLSQLLTPHRLDPVGRVRSDVVGAVRAVGFGAVSLVYAEHSGAGLAARLTAPLDYYDVNLSLAGRNLIRTGRREVLVEPGTAAVVNVLDRADMELGEHYRQLHVRIERDALERTLERLTGRPVVAPVVFSPRVDLRAPALASWVTTVHSFVAEADRVGGLADHRVGAAAWVDLLVVGLLLGQPHTCSHLLDRAPGPARPAPVRKVLQLIEDDPSADLTLSRLCAVAQLGPRSLQRHFHDSLGVSPLVHLQQVRLARAHADLQRGTPGQDSVTDIALRWGFTHVPRFAARYRERYGATPSQTLRAERPSRT